MVLMIRSVLSRAHFQWQHGARWRPTATQPPRKGGAPSTGRGIQFAGNAGTAALLDALSQFTHRFTGDSAPFAASEGILGPINGRQNLGASALTFFPQRKRLLDSILFSAESTTSNGLPDKRFLVGS